MSQSFIRQVIASWNAWRTQQRRYRVCPELRALDQAEEAARAAKKAVRPIQRQRQALMADMLRRGVHHG